MLAIRFNKNWWVAGAFCALAMNINTALGITEEEFNEKHNRLVNELGNFEFPELFVEFVAQRAGFTGAEGSVAYSACFLLCLGYSPNVILELIKGKNISPTAVILALVREYKDLRPDMHEILDKLATDSKEWKLDLSLSAHEHEKREMKDIMDLKWLLKTYDERVLQKLKKWNAFLTALTYDKEASIDTSPKKYREALDDSSSKKYREALDDSSSKKYRDALEDSTIYLAEIEMRREMSAEREKRAAKKNLYLLSPGDDYSLFK